MRTQLKKGTLELCVLSLLTNEDLYGFELVGRISAGIEIAEGSIYPLLKRIKDDGLVSSYLQESSEGPPRKYYSITGHGRASYDKMLSEWQQLVAGVNKIIGGRHE
jgi:PadR family transcriptional regulator PadR